MVWTRRPLHNPVGCTSAFPAPLTSRPRRTVPEARPHWDEELRVTRSHERETPAVWSYPLLCLAWRLGWGGRRLIPRDKSEGPGMGLHGLARGIEWLTGVAPDPSAD